MDEEIEGKMPEVEKVCRVNEPEAMARSVAKFPPGWSKKLDDLRQDPCVVKKHVELYGVVPPLE